MKRILLIAGILGFLVVAGIVVFLFTGLGAAIKAAVEGVGSRVTKTEVTLGSADVSLTSGEGTLKKLKVGNPEGFVTGSAIELGEIHVQIDTSSVTSDVIVIKDVLIDGPRLTYELGSSGTSNIGQIQSNIESFSGGGGGGGGGKKKGDGGGAAPRDDTPAAAKAESQKFIIEKIVIRNGRVDVSATVLKGETRGRDIPPIELKDLGKSSGGATGAEIAKEILGKLTDAALEEVKKMGIDEIEKGVTDKIGEALGGDKKKKKGK